MFCLAKKFAKQYYLLYSFKKLGLDKEINNLKKGNSPNFGESLTNTLLRENGNNKTTSEWIKSKGFKNKLTVIEVLSEGFING